jgi:predicted transcriptional regulator
MAKKVEIDKLSVYIPQNKIAEKPVERLIKLGAKRDRSVNYLVVEALIQYLEREEAKTE